MNLDQVKAVLAYASATDPRIRRNDPAERELQAQAWARHLGNVDQEAAVAAIDGYYARAGVDAILPGDIRAYVADRGSAQDQHPAYRPLADSITAAEHEAGGTDLPALPAAGTPRLGPEQARAALEAALRKIAAGRPIPESSPTGYVGSRERHSPRREPVTARIPAPFGAATTVCHGAGCVVDIAAPPGWDPANPASPRLYCDRHRPASDAAGVGAA